LSESKEAVSDSSVAAVWRIRQGSDMEMVDEGKMTGGGKMKEEEVKGSLKVEVEDSKRTTSLWGQPMDSNISALMPWGICPSSFY